jgi:hypothetical protein
MPQELIFTIAAMITATGVIIGSLVAIYKLARRIGDAIGVDKSGRTISERLERVEHQLWENGGSSLADRVNSIEAHAISTTAKLELIEALIVKNEENPIPTIKKSRVKKVS